ncbi:DUF4405 domain-containing protein [Mesobacterium sp. TK19101]|uniref:DUF4405 domain-containing protein n=1 Tax=Mesobacterium hydrothermale TaxID=3111907 RepID=A0ABU6HJ42_9RHOB|nr:DUF4405 domain-containing protein [Mesobacterium sp. TK19101]MEC3862470.1 DUF4405 domain-containing protein [Mesobacterium sp. TK19101]
MNLNLRKWATPLTAATFLITGVTGIVLFFHAGGTLSRVAHEWIGMAVMVVFLFHMALNWRAFTCYVKRPLAAAIMGLGVLATVLTSVPLGGGGSGFDPRIAFGAMQGARLETLADLAGKTPDALRAQLQAGGFDTQNGAQTVTDLSGGDRDRAMQVLAVAFAKAP